MPAAQRIRCRHPGAATLTRNSGIPSGSVTVPPRPRGTGGGAGEERLFNCNYFKIYGNTHPLFLTIISPFCVFFSLSLLARPNDAIAADLATLRTGIRASEHASGIIEGRGAMQEHEEIIMDSPWGATSETLRRSTGHHGDGKFLSSNKIFSGITRHKLLKKKKKMVDTKTPHMDP